MPLDLFGDEVPNRKPATKSVPLYKDITPPIAGDLRGPERSEPPLYCPSCGSGDLYLPCVGDLQGRTLAGWRCSRCWPDKTDHALAEAARIRERAKYYGVRVKREEFTPELEEE